MNPADEPYGFSGYETFRLSMRAARSPSTGRWDWEIPAWQWWYCHALGTRLDTENRPIWTTWRPWGDALIQAAGVFRALSEADQQHIRSVALLGGRVAVQALVAGLELP